MNFEEILEKYKTLIRYLVFRKIPVQDAEDIYQEICCAMFINYCNIRADEKIGSWIRSIVKHKIHDYYRKKEKDVNAKKKILENFEIYPELISSSPLPNLTIQIDNRKKVETLLNHLKDHHRDVIYMFFFQGFDASEIAEKMDIPVQKVYNLKSYAIAKLREIER